MLLPSIPSAAQDILGELAARAPRVLRLSFTHTSRLRAAVLLHSSTSTPALVIVLVFDSVPLKDPAEGWCANTIYWLRKSVGSALVGGAMLVQVQAVTPCIVFTRSKLLRFRSVSASYIGTLMILAANWKFSIPFAYTLGCMPQ